MSDKTKNDLHTSVIDGTVEDIEQCLLAGQSCNAHNENGLTALHLAVMRGRNDADDIIDLLARHEADINARCLVEESTALHMVVRYCELATAELIILKLLEHGADTDIRDRSLRRAYDYALQKDYVNLARLLSGDESVEKAIRELLENKNNYYGEKMILAIFEGDSEALEKALTRADVNYINKHGAGAIHYAINHSPLNKLNLLQQLVTAAADVNLQTYENDTALNLVIKTESLREDDVMYLLTGKLLEWGTDIEKRDLDGKDAVTLAKDRNYDDIVKLLRSHGATPPMEDPQIILYNAILKGTASEVQEAIKGEVNLLAENEEGYQPIHLAVWRKETSEKDAIIKVLLESGCDPNGCTAIAKKTAIHMAAEKDDLVAARTLLDVAGEELDVTLVDEFGRTAFDIATHNKNEEMILLLGVKNLKAKPAETPKKKNKTCLVM